MTHIIQTKTLNSKSFTDVVIDERTESDVSKSKFKTGEEEKVDNDNVELESFTDVAIDERTESKATESKFKTEVEVNSPLTNCQFFLLMIWLR